MKNFQGFSQAKLFWADAVSKYTSRSIDESVESNATINPKLFDRFRETEIVTEHFSPPPPSILSRITNAPCMKSLEWN